MYYFNFYNSGRTKEGSIVFNQGAFIVEDHTHQKISSSNIENRMAIRNSVHPSIHATLK